MKSILKKEQSKATYNYYVAFDWKLKKLTEQLLIKIRLELFFLVILSPIYLLSCKKSGEKIISVNGFVKNRLDNTPIAAVPIEIVACGGYPFKCLDSVLTTITDANGYYSGSFTTLPGRSYQISVGINEYVSNSFYPSRTSQVYLSKTKENKIDFLQTPFKNLSLNIKVLRHDYNFMGIYLRDNSPYVNFYKTFHYGTNPVIDYDSTNLYRVEAGEIYTAIIQFTNQPAPGGVGTGFESIERNFAVNNSDTAISIVIQ